MNRALVAPLMLIQAEIGLMLLCRNSWRRFIILYIQETSQRERRQEAEDYLVGVEEAQDGHGQLGEEDQRQAEGELKAETDIHRRTSGSDLALGVNR